MSYLLSLIGLTLLCAVWVKFQLWLKKHNNGEQEYSPGCGACQNHVCSENKEDCTVDTDSHALTSKTNINSAF